LLVAWLREDPDVARLLAQLAVDLAGLEEADFDVMRAESHGIQRVEALCEEMAAHPDKAGCAKLIFNLIERLDDAYLGTPGLPGLLVHTLEDWPGIYEPLLAESVRRHPTPLTTLMVQRIIRAKPPDVSAWRAALAEIEAHPEASDLTKQYIR
jgi:hypothetical protein